MTMHRTMEQVLATAIVAALMTSVAGAQHIPGARGSLDAMTVVPSTQPGAAPTGAPAGHPAMPGQGGMGGAAAMPGHPGKSPTSGTGALRVLIKPGTAGVTALDKDPVKVELFAKGQIVKTFHSTVGEKGVIEIEKLPLEPPFQAVITVTHNGVEEMCVGPPQHRYQPAIEMDMPVFETTAEKQGWTSGMRHVQVEAVRVEKAGQPDGLALQVTEMIGGFLPGEKAWTGDVVDGEARTLTVNVGANATNIQLGQGLAEARAKVVGNTVVRGKAMLPGSSQYVLGYTVPVEEGKAALTFTMPADTTLFALYVPAGAAIVPPAGLEIGTAGGSHGSESRQLVKGKGLKAGQVVTVGLSNIVPPKVVKDETPSELTNQQTDLAVPQSGRGK